MVGFFLVWFPIVAAVIMPVLFRTKKIWKATFIIFLTHVIVSFIAVVIITMHNMVVDGRSDPALVSGQIAERFVSSLLTSVFVVPLGLLLFVCWRKLITVTVTETID